MAGDRLFAQQVKDDYTKAGLTIRERCIADVTVKITRSPNACSPADVQALREVGLNDRDILNLVQIVSYYNLSTRLFESLSTVDE